ncbi:hypothetical protein LWI29_038198 [Acer saccharum]|uniref:Uncharacterized protein n=1 Tax=Acer saccharum TaxID=4024 RepID=A0AA39SPT5_ACESA|nr:hypothetical protein LWI29_038198 [Acer saccharum]
MVVDIENWPYNDLLGRPFLNKAKAGDSNLCPHDEIPDRIWRWSGQRVTRDGPKSKLAEVPKDFELDPREEPEDRKDEPTQEVVLDPEDPSRTVKVGASLSVHVKTQLVTLLRDYKDVFAWSHEDMLGVDPRVISHHLSINLEFRPVVQKRRLFNPERSVAIKKEVEKLLSAGSIREASIRNG